MTRELNEDTGFKVSIKTLIGIAFAIATVVADDVSEIKDDMKRLEEKIDKLR